ncbi:two-component regulator propeller domain-containing protein [Gracilimonas sediminicola]|uniref:two-component regulator propeller domain-containing protein n=1 Tax=Gracilimonas sediminicola TaxID=2952158 RepID=UPI0038D37CE3
MIIKRFTLLGFFALWLCVAQAQKYNLKTYSVNDGLPSSQVYDIHLSDNGFVWFATAFGLVKFDGFEFETYDKKNGLRDEIIYDIFEDSKKRFWVSTETGGVGLLEGDSVRYDPEFSVLDTMLINYVIESPGKEIWFGTDAHGVMVWDGSSYNRITTDSGLPSNQIWDIQFLRENEVWIATMNGVAVYKEEHGIFKSWKKEDGLSGEITYQAFEASDNTIWIPTNSGITLISAQDELNTITEINGQKLGYIYNIAEDDDGLIWIGTERKGLYWFDGEDYTHITKKNGLSSNYIYRLIKAADGTIWVATDGNGVSIFKDKQFRFFDKDSGVLSNGVYSLFQDEEGVIWFGKEDGLGSYNEGKFKTYEIPNEIFDEDEIWDIEQLPNGNLLLLTYNYWILEFDGERFFRSSMNEPLMDYYINDIMVEENGDIWIGTGQSLIKYDNGNLEVFNPSEEYWQAYINLIYSDSKGNLWLGTEGGLAKFDGEDFVYFTEEEGLRGSSVYEIKEDFRGNIWIGTNKGLYVIKGFGEEGSSVVIEVFEPDEIFLPETISLLFDDNGGLWQGTNGGLNYYDVEQWYKSGTMNKVHFALREYGKGLEFNGAAALAAADGYLWFGTASNGLLQYKSEKPPTSIHRKSPSTFIRKVYVNERKVYDQSTTSDDFNGLKLKHNQNNVEIEYGAVNYKDPYRMFYRYRLNGFEEKWNTGYDKREAVYTNLSPGEYSFEVMSKSPASDWSNQAAAITIEIAKPFWLSGWFILLCVVTGGGIIFFTVQVYVNIVEKRKLKELVDEQTADLKEALSEKEVLLKEVHHRVKNNMAVVSGLLDLQSWKMDDGHAKLALENSKLRIQTMSSIHEKLYQNKDLSKIDFKTFAEDLVRNVASSLKGDDKEVTVDLDIEEGSISVNSAIPCGLILNEALSNCYEHAFKETDKGSIKVFFRSINEHEYKLEVKDDGIGIPEQLINSKLSTLGLTLINSLVSQIKGTVEYKNEKGTTISIVIPK